MFVIRNKLLLMVVALMIVSATTLVQAQDDGLTESPDGPEAVKVYFTLEEALAKVFDKPDSTWSEVWEPTEAEISELENQLGWRVPPVAVEFHRARDGEKDLGWAVVTEEKGRFKPITFMVQVAPDGRVQMVAEGPRHEVAGLLDAIRREMGHYLHDAHQEHRPATGGFDGFQILL